MSQLFTHCSRILFTRKWQKASKVKSFVLTLVRYRVMLGQKFPCVALHTKKILQNVSDKKKNLDERRQKIGEMKEDLKRRRTAFGFVDRQQRESQTSRKIIFTPGGTKRKGKCVNAFIRTHLAFLYLCW